jgi:hypothetical protein
MSNDAKVEQRYNELLNDSQRVLAAIEEADGEDIGDYLYKVAESEIEEESENG